jgi:hypothetical protein
MINRAPIFLAASILAGLAFSQAAEAKRVQLEGHYSKSQIKAACAQAGGEDYIDGSVYGCENPDEGTSVYCNSSECWGYVPDSSKIVSAGTATAGMKKKDPPLGDMLKGQ